MGITLPKETMNNLIVVGDRVLIKPESNSEKTSSGLYLPPGVHEQEKIHKGYVVKVGPGYPIPVAPDFEESWKQTGDDVKYLPLQAKVGDLAVYLNKNGYEIEFNGEKYVILPQQALLLLIREDDFDF